jgi:TRAP-type C4-dicarboxylate transport system permease small subunit
MERVCRWFYLAAAYALLPLMVIVVCADVVARYVFAAPLQWAQEVTTLALLVFFVFALPQTTAVDGHIRVETLYERFSSRARALADLLGSLAGIAFMLALAYRSFGDAPGMARRGEGAEMINLPHWPLAVLIGIAAGFVCLLLLTRAFRAMHGLRGWN